MKECWAIEIHEFPDLQNRKMLISRITMVMAWYIYLQYFLYFLYFVESLQYIQLEIHEFPVLQSKRILVET